MLQVGYRPNRILLAPLAALYHRWRPPVVVTISQVCFLLLPKILAAPNRRSLATPGWVQTNLSFSSGRHFYLSPLAMQKVTTPLTTTSDSTNVKIFTIYVARYTYYTVVIVCYFCRQSVVFSFSDSITLIALFQGGLAIMTSDGACCVGGRDHVTHLVDECQS